MFSYKLNIFIIFYFILFFNFNNKLSKYYLNLIYYSILTIYIALFNYIIITLIKGNYCMANITSFLPILI